VGTIARSILILAAVAAALSLLSGALVAPG
jgi:hypothetical protein